jgi:hypothetical protein
MRRRRPQPGRGHIVGDSAPDLVLAPPGAELPRVDGHATEAPALGLLVLAANYYVPFFSMGEDTKMYIDCGLATVLICSLIHAVWMASLRVADEIEGKTAMTLLSKPINRRQFVWGKYVGIFQSAMFMIASTPPILWPTHRPRWAVVRGRTVVDAALIVYRSFDGPCHAWQIGAPENGRSRGIGYFITNERTPLPPLPALQLPPQAKEARQSASTRPRPPEQFANIGAIERHGQKRKSRAFFDRTLLRSP